MLDLIWPPILYSEKCKGYEYRTANRSQSATGKGTLLLDKLLDFSFRCRSRRHTHSASIGAVCVVTKVGNQNYICPATNRQFLSNYCASY